MQFIEHIAKYFSYHPLLLPKSILEITLYQWQNSVLTDSFDRREAKDILDAKPPDLIADIRGETYAHFAPIFLYHCIEDILFRSLLLSHLNDLAIALQPLITPLSGDEIVDPAAPVSKFDESEQDIPTAAASATLPTTTETNYPVQMLLTSMKGYFFDQVRLVELLHRLTIH